MPQDTSDTLAAFVSDKKRFKCKVCRLASDRPELWQEIRLALAGAEPPSQTDISAWLQEKKGVTVPPYTIRDHFLLRHEETR